MTQSRKKSIITKLFILVFLSSLGMAGLLPEPASAGEPVRMSPRTAVVDVTRKDHAGEQRLVRFTVVLTENAPPARLSLRHGGASYELRLRCDRARQQQSTVNLDVRWADHPSGKATDNGKGKGKRRAISRNEVSMSSLVTLGQRVLMGKVERADGAELRINLQLK